MEHRHFHRRLGVYDFMKKSSIIHYTEQALQDVAEDIITIANAEGLTAHANSIQVRKADLMRSKSISRQTAETKIELGLCH